MSWSLTNSDGVVLSIMLVEGKSMLIHYGWSGEWMGSQVATPMPYWTRGGPYIADDQGCQLDDKGLITYVVKVGNRGQTGLFELRGGGLT